MPRRFWTCTIITTISALVSAGFSVVGLLAPSSSDSFARYAASRSIALLIAVLFCLGVRLREGIAALAVVMSLVQGFDGIIGILAHDPARPIAPLFLPSRISLGLCGCWAHRKGWREGLLWTAPLCGEAKSKLCPELVSDVECSAAPELA